MDNIDKYVKKLEKDIKDLEHEKFKVKHKKGIRNLKIVGVCTLFAVITTGYTIGAIDLTNNLCGTDSLFSNRIHTEMVTEYNYDSYGESFTTVVKDTEDNKKHTIRIFGNEENGKRLCCTLVVDELDINLVNAVKNQDYAYIKDYIDRNVLTDIIDSTKDYDGGYIEICEHDTSRIINYTRNITTGENIIKFLFFFIVIGFASFFTSIIYKNDYSYPSIWNKVIDIIQNADLEEFDLESINNIIENKKEELSLFKGM